jgi:hypothetical protein
MTFSHNWLENLISKYDWKNCIASRLIESWRFFTWKHWLEKNFWTEFFNYKENEFINYAEEYKDHWAVKDWWLYMPLFINKNDFVNVWMYPEWNLKKWSDLYSPTIADQKDERSFTWDEALIEKLRLKWIKHITSFDSIVYHFQAWELSYNKLNSKDDKINICIFNDIVTWTMWEKVLWDYLIDNLPWNIFWIDKKLINSDSNFEKKSNEYLNKIYPNTDIIIQNATFISKMANNIPTISYLQDDIRKMWQNTLLQEENLQLSDLIITNSIYTQESYNEYDSEIIPIWLNNELFNIKDRSNLRDKYEIPEWLVWIFVWSLLEAKWWIEIQEIIKTNKTVKHWIIVSKYQENIEFENISFFSQVSQEKLAELINCADFFILGSKVETQCLAAIEACLCNVPVIMRNVWIFKEFSIKEKNKLWEFSDDFNESIEILSTNINNYNPRITILNKNLDINSMINKWIIVISRFLILSKRIKYLWGIKSTIKVKNFVKIEIYFRKNFLSKFWLSNINFKNLFKLKFYKYHLIKIIIKILWK